MEVEKRSTKGGFLQLFDWNVKSRKKLFSNKPELPDNSIQGKENNDSSEVQKLQKIKMHDDNWCDPILRGQDADSGDSLISYDEGFTRPPGVVARLMGLDSLPTSNVSEPPLTLFLDSSSRDSHKTRRNDTDFLTEYQFINYGNVQNKSDGFSRNAFELKLQKMQNRPIERFQTEILPPKSAKSIPITHNRLLSPIKSPGFVPTRNPAYIMEAAAKIIEQSPRSTTIGKFQSSVSPSVPLRFHGMKGKIEAAAPKACRHPEKASLRSKELGPSKSLKEKSSERIRCSSADDQLKRAPTTSRRVGSENFKNRGKSASLAVQAKDDVQKRESLASTANRSSMNHKVVNEIKSGHLDRNRTNTQKSSKKHSTSKTSDALRQNNQKQNCTSPKDSVNTKSFNQSDPKVLSANGFSRPNKVVANFSDVTRKTNLVTDDLSRALPRSKTKSFSRKKRPVDGDVQIHDHNVRNESVNTNERPVKCNVSIDGHMNWDAIDRKVGMDVISFTFTSPIKKSGPALRLSELDERRNKNLSFNSHDDQAVSKCSDKSPQRMNLIGSDALNELLDQKLKELSCRVASSHSDMVKEGPVSCSGSSLLDSMPYLDDTSIVSMEYVRRLQLAQHTDKANSPYGFDCFSVDGLHLKGKQKLMGLEEIAEHENSKVTSENRKELDRQGSPVSSLEPSFSDGCSSSPYTKTNLSCNGSEQSSSIEAHEMVNSMSARQCNHMEIETELSDSASSFLVHGIYQEDIPLLDRLTNWEVAYVADILDTAELVPKDSSLDHCTHKIITSDLFDQLENQRTGSDKNMDGELKLGRKVLFDCVNECLECRWVLMSDGSYRSWVRGTRLFRRKERLVEEIYKEMHGWTSMEELMVDEVVEKDMNSKYGKWIDFEIEAYEEGIEIEKEILTCMVEELVADFYSQEV